MATSDLNTGPGAGPHVWILEIGGASGEDSEASVWGLSAAKRLRRNLERAGAASIDELANGAPPPPPQPGPCVLIRADYFYDERLISGLLEARNVVLVSRVPGTDQAVALAASVDGAHLAQAVDMVCGREPPPNASSGDGLRSVAPLDLAPAYNPALRKHDPPFVYRARAEEVRRTEDRIFASSYKGITDLVTKWVFPLPARAVTRKLAERGVRPNTITAISYALTLLVIWLFYEGYFAAGLVAGWLMSFLDTVDGKLARVTLTSSKLGGALDHGLDLVHPPIWWAAWAYGLAPDLQGVELLMWVIVGGYFVGRLLEGVFLAAFKIEVFVWRPFDAFFRTIIARRNPNLLLLSAGVLCGRPGEGYAAVAVWTLVCIAVALARIYQAFGLKRAGVAILPWQKENQAPAASDQSTRSSHTR
jgi:phosphatidylglycerophosphate synthase